MAELRSELRHLMQGWFSLKLVALVMLILFLDYAAIALLHAFRLELPPEAPLGGWVFLAAGSTPPSVPGYVGVYQLAAVWARSLFVVPASGAVAIATSCNLPSLLLRF